MMNKKKIIRGLRYVVVGLLFGTLIFMLWTARSRLSVQEPMPTIKTMAGVVFTPEATMPTETPVILPSPTNTPIPTNTPTPTITPWVYPTPIYDPETSSPYGLPTMINPIEPAWEDDVEVYVLLGSDYGDWRQDWISGTDNTDAFIIVIVNHVTSRISLLSIPRDLYVFQPGFGMSRVNTTWRHGGEQMLADTIRYNFGLPFHGYAYVRMASFSRFIDDALHGIDVQVRKAVLDYCGGIKFNMLPGTHFMDGPTALCYARIRMYDGTFARDTRQREVLLAMKDKFKQIAENDPISLALEIFKSYSAERQYTSIGVDDVLRLLPLALDAEVVEFQLDYLWGVTHFSHPDTGAWLLNPPSEECLSTLMYNVVWGDPWIFLPEDWLVETCGVERE